MTIALETCDANDARLVPLLREYLREWSTLVAVPVGADGRFVYEQIDHVDRLLFLVDREAVGFAFTTRDDEGRIHVEEFFIDPPVRRGALGTRAVHALFACAPDATWTWTVRPENPGALAFWRCACPRAIEAVEPRSDGIVRARFTIMR